MVHVLLPFMVLPLYSVMKRHPADLCARRVVARRRPFTRVPAGLLAADAARHRRRLPDGLHPGLGYYITPALVGGADDQMISYFIAFYTSKR